MAFVSPPSSTAPMLAGTTTPCGPRTRFFRGPGLCLGQLDKVFVCSAEDATLSIALAARGKAECADFRQGATHSESARLTRFGQPLPNGLHCQLPAPLPCPAWFL